MGREGRLFKLAVFVLVVFAAWWLLSGVFSPLFLAFGILASVLGVVIGYRMKTEEDDDFPGAYVYRAPLYALWLLKEIAKASIAVTRIIWRPKLNLEPAFAWIPSGQRNSTGLVTFANSITLTPGTVSVLVRGNQIGVHALEQSGLDDLREGEMDRRVQRLSKGGKA